MRLQYANICRKWLQQLYSRRQKWFPMSTDKTSPGDPFVSAELPTDTFDVLDIYKYTKVIDFRGVSIGLLSHAAQNTSALEGEIWPHSHQPVCRGVSRAGRRFHAKVPTRYRNEALHRTSKALVPYQRWFYNFGRFSALQQTTPESQRQAIWFEGGSW